MDFPKSLVIVPTYNEKENILLIISAILEQNACLEVLVVDDGSVKAINHHNANDRFGLNQEQSR